MLKYKRSFLKAPRDTSIMFKDTCCLKSGDERLSEVMEWRRMKNVYWALPHTRNLHCTLITAPSGWYVIPPVLQKRNVRFREVKTYLSSGRQSASTSLPHGQSQPVQSPPRGRPKPFFSCTVIFSSFLSKPQIPLKNHLLAKCDDRDSKRSWGSNGWTLLKHICIMKLLATGVRSRNCLYSRLWKEEKRVVSGFSPWASVFTSLKYVF